MFYLIVILGLISMAAGVFVVGFGIPIRETMFGSGLLVAGSVAITGGFILVALAAAVAELQLAVQALKARVPAVPRPLRPVERKDGTEKRPDPPRMALSPRPGPDGPHPMQPNPMQPNPIQPNPMQPSPAQGDPMQFGPEPPPAGPPPMDREEPVRKPGPEWLRRAMAEIESGPDPALAGPEPFRGDDRRPLPDDWPPPVSPLAPPTFPQATTPAPEPAPPEPRPAPVTAQNIFDKVWPSERRKAPEGMPEKRAEAIIPPRAPEPWPLPAAPAPPPRAVESRPAPAVAPPPPPPPRVEPRPPAILKSGVIDEMAYTLFTDGSIEAQMPDGTMRFASIDALRDHLEKHDG